MNVVIKYLIMILIILSVFYTVSQFKKLRKIQNERKKILGEKRIKNTPLDLFFNKYAQKGYNIIARIPILKKIMFHIRKKLETLSVYDEYSLRKEVMRIIFIIVTIALIAFALIVAIRPSFLFVFWIMVGLLLATGILVDYFVYKVEYKLLSQLKDFNTRIRFNYQKTKMVDEAFHEALEFAGPEMKKHAERMNKILNSLDMEEELARYEEVAPSRFLRVVAGLAVLVKDRGDKFDKETGSAFLAGLQKLNMELNNELLYRSRLAHAMRSLSTLALIPVFFTLPIRNYSISSFPVTIDFYNSRLGFFMELLIYGISIVCYLIIRKMREVSERREELNPRKNRWENWIFTKIPFVEKICVALSPRENTKKHYKLRDLIKQTNDRMTVKELTLRRLIFGLVAVILIIGAFFYSHVREVHNTLNYSVQNSMFTSSFSQMELDEIKEKTEYDKEIISKLQEKTELPNQDELSIIIANNLGKDVSSEEVGQALERITKKWQTINNAYLKWYEVLLAIVLAYTASRIPLFILYYKRKTYLKLMEYETYQLIVIITVLKSFESMSTVILLEWMKRFSITFRPALTIALEEFDSGQKESLEKLIEQNSFEPFQHIIQRLLLSLDRLSIEEAFNDIDVERQFYLEQRKEEQDREVESKTNIGSILGLTPLVSLVLIYLVFPIMYVALSNTSTVFEMLQ